MIEALSDKALLVALGILYLIDNSTRIAPGAFRFRRAPAGAWSVSHSQADGPRSSLVFPVPILQWGFAVAPESGGSPRAEEAWDKLRRLEPAVRRLAVLSSVAILSLFVGYPLGHAAFSAVGGVTAMGLSVAASLAVATLSYRAFRSLGCDAREAFRLARGLAWPLQAPAAPGRVFGRATRGFHPLAVARALLADREFQRLVRPYAYDDRVRLAHGDAPALVAGSWNHLLYPRTFPASLAFPWSGSPSPSYCPRCGREFRVTSGDCVECEVALVVEWQDG